MATGAVLGASKHLEFSTFAAVSLHPLQNQQRRYPPAGASLPLLPNLGGARSREDPGRPPRWGATSVKAGRAASKDLGDDKGKVSPISYGPPTNVLSLCHPQIFGKGHQKSSHGYNLGEGSVTSRVSMEDHCVCRGNIGIKQPGKIICFRWTSLSLTKRHGAPVVLIFRVNGFVQYSKGMLNFLLLYDHLVSKLNFPRQLYIQKLNDVSGQQNGRLHPSQSN
nr:uncharacterized protein LOC127305973 [Lolium perenne]